MLKQGFWAALLITVMGLAVFLWLRPATPLAPHGIVLNRGNVAEPDTLDPPQYGLAVEVEIMDDLFLGLTTRDQNGSLIPGAAERWDISADGRTYTFHLRKGLRWSDGSPLTAMDFVAGIRRMLDPATHSQFANFAYKIHNGQAINEGKLPPQEAGVSAPDDRTLVIQLDRPSPILIVLTAIPLFDPLPRAAVARFGKDWIKPGNMVSNGAFTLAEWVPQGHVRLKKNPYFYDAKNVQIDEVNFFPTDDDAAALKRFRARELDFNMRFPPTMLDWLKRNLPGEALIAPNLALTYLTFNLKDPVVGDLSVRRALSLAIDRERLTNQILHTGEIPAFGLIPPAIKGYAGSKIEGAGVPYVTRLAQARALLATAGYGPRHPLSLTFHCRLGELNRRIAVAVQAMWSSVGVNTDIVTEEVAMHYNRLRTRDFQVADAGWQAPPDPEYYMYLLKTQSTEANYASFSDAEFDRLTYDAEAVMDTPSRYAAYARAEKIALDALPIVPLFFPVNRAIVQPYVKGYVENALDVHPSRYIRLSPH
ncbi:MAG: peptide ABC transporter substrate-binding protein [Rhizomicrobium sp.]